VLSEHALTLLLCWLLSFSCLLGSLLLVLILLHHWLMSVLAMRVKLCLVTSLSLLSLLLLLQIGHCSHGLVDESAQVVGMWGCSQSMK
jgi:hypothetical protein